jgi:hypothetical protein
MLSSYTAHAITGELMAAADSDSWSSYPVLLLIQDRPIPQPDAPDARHLRVTSVELPDHLWTQHPRGVPGVLDDLAHGAIDRPHPLPDDRFGPDARTLAVGCIRPWCGWATTSARVPCTAVSRTSGVGRARERRRFARQRCAPAPNWRRSQAPTPSRSPRCVRWLPARHPPRQVTTAGRPPRGPWWLWNVNGSALTSASSQSEWDTNATNPPCMTARPGHPTDRRCQRPNSGRPPGATTGGTSSRGPQATPTAPHAASNQGQATAHRGDPPDRSDQHPFRQPADPARLAAASRPTQPTLGPTRFSARRGASAQPTGREHPLRHNRGSARLATVPPADREAAPPDVPAQPASGAPSDPFRCAPQIPAAPPCAERTSQR